MIPSRSPLWRALGLVGQLGFTIAVPLVVLALVGRLADKHYGTSPWLLLAGIGLSIIISSLALVRKFSALMRDIDQPPPTS
jgi:F0F1-type ATP synthase assembly protein I